MAADSKPPPPNLIQRAAETQARYAGGFKQLIHREAAFFERLTELSRQDDNLPVALGATKFAVELLERYRAAFGDADDRPLTADEEREARELAESLRRDDE